MIVDFEFVLYSFAGAINPFPANVENLTQYSFLKTFHTLK